MCRYLMRVLVLLMANCLPVVPVHADDEARRRTEPQAEQADVTLDQRIETINSEIKESLSRQLAEIPKIDEKNPDAFETYSKRGDLHMFLADFSKAETDYLQMVKLKPDVDSSHWRLGIAMYFADHAEKAAAQFDKYHSFDNIDRENGIWRYLSHRRAFGLEKAREQMLKYEKDDRPPFKEVYRLFDGSLTPDDVLKAIPPGLPETARNARLFYSHLYVGMNYSAEGETDLAIDSLQLAILNPWPRAAGFGPDYMWHIGRLQYQKLKTELRQAAQP